MRVDSYSVIDLFNLKALNNVHIFEVELNKLYIN